MSGRRDKAIRRAVQGASVEVWKTAWDQCCTLPIWKRARLAWRLLLGVKIGTGRKP